jgi:chromosome segregation ATPase
LFVKLREESQQWAAHADDTRRLAGQVQTLEKRLADVESALVQWSESSTPLPLSREAQHPADDLGDPVRRLAGERDEGRVADEALLPRVQQTETQYAARVDATAALASVQEAIARLEERWAWTTTRVDDLGARMEAMESVTDQFEVLIREVENVKSALAELGARFDAERDARKEVEETVDQTRALVEAFRASVQDVISKLERLRSAAAQIVVETAGSPPSHETRPPSEGEPEVVVLSELAEEEPQVDSQAMLGTFLRFMGPSQENTC